MKSNAQDMTDDSQTDTAETQAQAPAKKDAAVLELLASRICHDLISPVGAINNGVTQDEIRAIIHVIGIYCGVPQALECFRVARKVLNEQQTG